MRRQVRVRVGPDAAQLRRDVVDHRLAPVVELRLPQVPRLPAPHHRVQLMHRGDQGELRVLQDLGVSLSWTRSR